MKENERLISMPRFHICPGLVKLYTAFNKVNMCKFCMSYNWVEDHFCTKNNLVDYPSIHVLNKVLYTHNVADTELYNYDRAITK